MRLTSNIEASLRRSELRAATPEWTFEQIKFVAGRRGAVVKDNFYIKLKRLNVQAGKRDKILAVHVQRICEANDTVMRSYYQQIQARKAQCTRRENGYDSGGACATHMRSA